MSKYLDDFFESILNQRLEFKRNIKIIMVDDGSTDSSRSIIRKYQKKYPNNIQYLYKENGGQASARNFGLEFAKTEWVTFIDPDDLIDSNYFLYVDKFIGDNKGSSIDLLSCNFIFFFEDVAKFKDSHPLNYRFSKGDVINKVSSLGVNIQLSVNSAFFRRSIIKSNLIRFDENIKPNFEDAHFASNYLMSIKKSSVAFLKSAKYFYRKRSDGSSTLDKSWENPGLYKEVLERGCLNILQKSALADGRVPDNIQITVVYHLIWYFKKLINSTHKINFLDSNQKIHFLYLMDEIFSFLDEKVIMDFSLAGCWFFHKVGMLGAFKNIEPSFQIAYIESYDHVKKLVQIRFFSHNTEVDVYHVNGVDTIPVFSKTMIHDFVGREFAREQRVWIKLGEHDELTVNISRFKTSVSLGGKLFNGKITGGVISRHFMSLTPSYVTHDDDSRSWLFMDRDFQADDNAEHLYRYVKNNHPEQSIFFAIKKTSHDWMRLKEEGFNLLDFGSEQHKKILRSCSKVISSHVDHCVVNLLGPKMLVNRHFVFLQHGVTKDDLSEWLNSKDNIDCFITASKNEYDSIALDYNRYKFTTKEVVLTGFPRHDSLIKRKSHQKQILIMPTWRASVAGKSKMDGHERELNPDFMSSVFASNWYSFLSSEFLKDKSLYYDFNVVFYPHPNLLPYINKFDIPEYIEVIFPNQKRIQDVFCESSILITDYSSVAFEMAIQDKPTIYYQFDETEVFSGAHTYAPGYFNYREHGFGPVCSTEKEVFYQLSNFLANDGLADPEILNRIRETFPVRDGDCCRRTYEAILKLDKPLSIEMNVDVMRKYAVSASQYNYWSLACQRWKILLNHEGYELNQPDAFIYIDSLIHAGQLNEAEYLYNEHFGTELDLNDTHQISINALLLTSQENWISARKYWEYQKNNSQCALIYYTFCCAHLHDAKSISVSNERFIEINLIVFIDICRHYADKNYQQAIQVFESWYSHHMRDELGIILAKAIYLSSLRLSDCCEKARIFSNNEFHSAAKGVFWLNEIIAIYDSLNDFDAIVSVFNDFNIHSFHFNEKCILSYMKSLRLANHKDLFYDFIKHLPERMSLVSAIKREIAECFLAFKNWESASIAWSELIDTDFFDAYKLSYSFRMQGLIEEAMTILVKNKDSAILAGMRYWVLKSELAQIQGDWAQSAACWTAILRYHADEAPVDAILNLQHAQIISKFSNADCKLA